MATAAVLNILVKANTAGATAQLARTQKQLRTTATHMGGVTKAGNKMNTSSRSVGKGLGTLGGAVGGTTGKLVKLAGAASGVAVAYLAIAEAKQAVNTTTELAKATISLNKNLGISVEKAGEWAAVAKTRGVEMKALNQAFGTLSKQMDAASTGSAKSADAFMRLGVTQKELKKLGFQNVLGEVSDGLKEMGPGADRTALAMKLFGRGWQTIVPVLRDGSKGMQEQLDLAKKYGATFSGGTVKSMKDFIAAQREAKFATLGLQIAFGTKLAPILTSIITHFSKFVAEMRSGEGAGGKFASIMSAIGNTLSTIFHLITDNKGVMKALVVAVVAGTAAWAAYRVTVAGAAVATTIATGGLNLIIPALVALAAAIATAYAESKTFRKIVQDVFDRIKAIVRGTGQVFAAVWRGIKKTFGDVMAFILRRFADLFEIASKLPFVGGKFKDLAEKANNAADKIDRAGEKTKDLRTQISNLHGKELDIKVNLLLNDPATKKLVPFPMKDAGDPRSGLEKAIARGASKMADNNALVRMLAPSGGVPSGNTGRKAQTLMRLFNLRWSSGYRTPDHNRAVGGVPNSLHTHGSPANPGAFDLVGTIGQMMKARAYAIKHWHPLEALIHDAGSGLHLHLGFFEKGGKARSGGQMAVVGERGPEIVSLPSGAEVFSHSQSAQIARRMGGMLPGFASGNAAQTIWSFMRGHGFSPEQAAGWLGVFQKESNFSTTARNPRSGATGLAQWLGGRLTGLKSRRNWTALSTQLNYVWHELMSTEKAAYRAIREATTVASAALAIDSRYERSDAILGAVGYAQNWYKQFGGKGKATNKSGAKAKLKRTPPKILKEVFLGFKGWKAGPFLQAIIDYFEPVFAAREMQALINTPNDTRDELQVYRDAEKLWAGYFRVAELNKDNAGIVAIGNLLRTARDNIDTITSAGAPPEANSAVNEALRQLLREANQRTAVSQAQYTAFSRFYGGSFAGGGVVPGPIGAPRVIVAHGGERVSNGDANVELNFGPGMAWLERYIEVKVDGVTRKQARGGRTPLPGRGGGLRRG